MVARLEFADHLYFHYERQESEQRPTKRAFGRANSGLVFQEAQLLDPFSVPMLHLFYGDKSFSRAHRAMIVVIIQFMVRMEKLKMQNMHVFRIYAKNMQICIFSV